MSSLNDIPTSIQGLENLGNTCYMNSIMQCLANCDTLLHSVLSSNHRRGCSITCIGNNDSIVREANSKGRPDICVQCAFETCILQMKYPSVFKNNTDQYYNTADSYNLTTQFYRNHPLIHIINILPFISLEFGRQEDAHEFLLNLLLCIERSDISSVSISPSTRPYVGSIFGSSLISSITCFDCGAISTKSEQIQDIQLEINKAATLQTAMTEYCKLENLVGSESYFCSRCNNFSSCAQKSLQLESLSDLVRLQLKRFAFDASTGQSYKLGHYVEYPSFFDFGPHIVHKQGKSSAPPQYFTPTKDGTNASNNSSSRGKRLGQSTTLYELVSLVVHSGKSPHTGHYIAYVKSKTGRWMMVNDDKVTVVSTEEALQQYAYILFYQKVSSPPNTMTEVPPKMLFGEDRFYQRSQIYASNSGNKGSVSGELGHPSSLKNRSIRIYRTPTTVQSLSTRPMTDSSPRIPSNTQNLNSYNNYSDGWAYNSKSDPIPPQEEAAMLTPREAIKKTSQETYDTTSGKKRRLSTDSIALTDSERLSSVADGNGPSSSSISTSVAPQRLTSDSAIENCTSPPVDDGDDGEIFSPKKRPALRPMHSLTSFLSSSLSAAAATATMMMTAKRPNKLAALKDTDSGAVNNEEGHHHSKGSSWMKLFRGSGSGSSISSNSSKYQVGGAVEPKESDGVSNEDRIALQIHNHSQDNAIKYAIGSSTNHFQDRDRQHVDRDGDGDRTRLRGDIPTSHSAGQHYYIPIKSAMQQRSSGMVSRAAPSHKRRADAMTDSENQSPISGLSSSKRTNSGSLPPVPSILPSSKMQNGILQVVSNAFSNILFVPDATDDD